MKKTIVFGMFSVVITMGCGDGSKGSQISGKIEGAEGKSIYLERFVNDRPVRTDSTKVGSDGTFQMVPVQALELNFYKLVIDNDHYTVLITDSTEKLEVKTSYDNMKMGVSFSGSKDSEKLGQFYSLMEPYAKKFNEMRAQATAPGVDPEVLAQVKTDYQALMMEKNEKCKEWLKSNSNSPAALAALNELDIRTDLDSYMKVRDELKDSFGHSFYYKEISKRIDAASNQPSPMVQQPQVPNTQQPQAQTAKQQGPIAVGMTAPELAAADPKGKTIRLSDFKGKVVLVDFWASWCGPCRRENPAVVAAYNKYHKQGFEVLSVSLDNSAEKWHQAIAADGLIWDTHISDLKGWQSQLAAAYGVQSIPCPVLIGKDGKIINFGQAIRGPMLDQQLVSLFGN